MWKQAPTTPQYLTVEQFELVVATLHEPYRTMVQIAQCLGLRVSEIAALQWDGFDFEKDQFLVQRSFVSRRVDDVKAEYSQDFVPLHPSLTKIVLDWSKQVVNLLQHRFYEPGIYHMSVSAGPLGPTVVMSIGWKPNCSAGDFGCRRKSNFLASTKRGPAMRNPGPGRWSARRRRTCPGNRHRCRARRSTDSLA
jgi:hypothetical protein